MVEVLCVDPKFRLHFKDRNVAFANGLARLFNNEKQCDLTIVVDGKELKAHRHILSFVSKELKKHFDELQDFGPIEVEWNGGSFEIVKDVLHYIYNGLVKIRQTNLPAFVEAAQIMNLGTSLQNLDLDAVLGIKREFCEIIYDNCGEEFVEGFQKLYKEEKHFDVTLQIDGKELKAHRHVLSACSPYFESMFSVCDIKNPLQVLMDDIDHVTFESLQNVLRYIYHGEVTVGDLVPLLNIGEVLEISGLERADNLVADKPSEENSNVFNVHSSSKNNARTIQPVKIKANRPSKVVSREVRSLRRDSDSEGSIYDPANDSDNGTMVLRRRNPMAKGSKPKNAPNTRMQNAKIHANVSFTRKKLVKVPQQMMNKAQPIPKQTQSTNASRREKQTKVRVKSKNANKTPDTLDIPMTPEEFEQVASLHVENDEDLEQEEVDDGYSQEYESNDEVEVQPKNLKRKRADQNNNKHHFGSHAINQSKNVANFTDYDDDGSQDWEFTEKGDYEYGSDDGAVGDSTVSYGENVYVEDLTMDNQQYVQSNQAWLSEDVTYDESANDRQQHAVKKKDGKKKERTGGNRPRHSGLNGIPLSDDDYAVEANIISTKQSDNILANAGHRYCMNRKGIGYNRWLCNQIGASVVNKCTAYAYTKKINGVHMACYPPNHFHNHKPLYTCDMD